MPSATRNGVLFGFVLALAYWVVGPVAIGAPIALAAGLFLVQGDLFGGWQAGLVSGLTASALLAAAAGIYTVVH